jgi:hypothetical protein
VNRWAETFRDREALTAADYRDKLQALVTELRDLIAGQITDEPGEIPADITTPERHLQCIDAGRNAARREVVGMINSLLSNPVWQVSRIDWLKRVNRLTGPIDALHIIEGMADVTDGCSRTYLRVRAREIHTTASRCLAAYNANNP